MSRTPQQIAADRARYEEHQRKGLAFATRALPEASPRPAPAIAPAAVIGHSELRPLRLKAVELRHLEAFLRTLGGPVVGTEPAADGRAE